MKPTFREMMGILPTGIHPHKDGLAFDLYDEAMLDTLEQQYQQKISFLQKKAPSKIPSIVHFIWLGPKPFPKESIVNVESWKRYNPTWELYFWTDDKERNVPIKGMQKRLLSEYDFKAMAPLINLSSNWGEKSDLMRYAILEELGGFYSDHDSEILTSFEPFLQFDSVICCEEPAWRGGIGASHILFQNGLFGVAPHHPVLQRAMYHVDRIWHELDANYPDGDKPTASWKVLRRTFDPFTLAVKENVRSNISGNDLILPTCSFFPNRILSEEDIQRFIKCGVIYSLHKYAGLWADGAWGDIHL